MSRNTAEDRDRYEFENHDRGLAFDLNTLVARRRALKLMGGAGLLALVGCSTTDTASTSTSSTGTPGTTSSSAASSANSATSTASSSTGSPTSTTLEALEDIPAETAGPYPGDGSNGPNVLTESGIVRSDIRSSFGSSTTTAAGVPLTITLNIQDNDNGVIPLAGAAVYLWHCDMEGRYSMYSSSVTNENYLRGVLETDANGSVSFTSIFPAAYSGRWPHVHFEVYPSLAEATAAGDPRATSQLALPEEACNTVYATDGYSQSVRNLARTSLASDNVFGDDDADRQLATVTGNVTDGFVAVLNLAV